MAGGMSGLYIGLSGLRTSQNSLNTTAHNIANVDTKGYVRQQALHISSMNQTVGASYISLNQVGLGSDIATIRQVRDQFLDTAYRKEIGRQGFYEIQYEAIGEVEDLFGEMEGVAFQDTLENFWVSLQEMAKEPDSIVTRDTFINTAVSFMERSENIYRQLKDYQINLNTKIQQKVDRINQIGKEITKLNQNITIKESSRERANDYRDTRNNLLDELGQLAQMSYYEQADGTVNVLVEHIPFVSGDQFYKMKTEPIEEDSPMLKVVWDGNGAGDVFDFSVECSGEKNTDGGSLKGLLLARGSRVGNYTDIPIKPNEADYTDEEGWLDEDAYEEAVQLYNAKLEEYNTTIQPSLIMTIQSQFDQLVHGVVTKINDVLCPNIQVEVDGELIMILDEEKAPVGMDENRTVGEALFNRKSSARYELITANIDGEVRDVYKYIEEDPQDTYSMFTLGQIEVNPEILNNISKLPLNTKNNTGDYDIEACKKLMEVWQEPFATLGPDALAESNFQSYYTAFIADIANRGQLLNKVSESQQSMTNDISNQRLSVTGVSSDEELTNMIKYQHAYNAASRYINVVDQMLEHIITKLG